MHVAVSLELLVDGLDDIAGNGESDTLAAARLREDERVDADQAALHVNQRAAAVAGIDGGVGLDIGERAVLADLARGGADHAHRDGVLQAERAAERENNVAL